jgi:hypothetical protein
MSGATDHRPVRHSARIVALGLVLGIVLYLGYLALGMVP